MCSICRGVGQASDSSSESSTESDSTDEPGSEQDSEDAHAGEVAARWGAGAMAANPAEQIAEGVETRRVGPRMLRDPFGRQYTLRISYMLHRIVLSQPCSWTTSPNWTSL